MDAALTNLFPVNEIARQVIFFHLRWNNACAGASTLNAVFVRKAFFFEKKNQKTFIPPPAARLRLSPTVPQPEAIKVFCFFSSEKKTLSDFEASGQGGAPFSQPT